MFSLWHFSALPAEITPAVGFDTDNTQVVLHNANHVAYFLGEELKLDSYS